MLRCSFPRHRLLLLSLLAAVALMMFAPHAWAQERQDQETAALDRVGIWKILNFLLFAAGLGWAIWKYAPAFFNARSADIQKAIEDATGLKIEADFRRSDIDKRMANISAEIAQLEQQGNIEMEREHQRLLGQGDEELEHIRKQVAAELEGFRYDGMLALRRQTAQRAIDSASRKLQDRFASGEPGDLLQDFVHLVERGHN